MKNQLAIRKHIPYNENKKARHVPFKYKEAGTLHLSRSQPYGQPDKEEFCIGVTSETQDVRIAFNREEMIRLTAFFAPFLKDQK